MSAAAAHGPREALALFALGLGLSVAIGHIPEQPESAAASFKPLLMFLVWIAPAYVIAARRGQDPLVAHAVLAPPTGLRPAVLVSLALLAAYVLGFMLWARVAGLSVTDDPALVVRGTIEWLLWGFLFVALPEEYFFRGVLQPALDPPEGRGRRLRVLGADLARGALVSALLFGLAHIIMDAAVKGSPPTPERAATALSALWFAWLRARTGNVLPAAVAHAVANAVFYACHHAYGLP